MAIGRKQNTTDEGVWHQALANAAQAVSSDRLDDVIAASLAVVDKAKADRHTIGWAWSGGKDSQGLRYVMEQAGIEPCVIGITAALEWPAMLAWITDHMPPGCQVYAAPKMTLEWLAGHPNMLFPQGGFGPAWFKPVQHTAQRRFFHAEKLTLLALGRRRRDGNYIGPAGADRYTDRHGVTRWSPIADWSHEELLALIVRESLPLPPCYDWPRGFLVGTGAWPARQWTRDTDHGFAECWQIDPDVIRAAGPHLPAAAD